MDFNEISQDIFRKIGQEIITDQISGRTKEIQDENLYNYIVNKIGLYIPRVAVCPGHVAPFEFLADMYFERVYNACNFAARGVGKTTILAVLHALNSVKKTGCETASVGAIEMQAKRCYQYFLNIVRHNYRDQLLAEPTLQNTLFKNHSKVEILPGTINAVNAPHPQKTHLDEFELTTWEIYQEFLNMAQGHNDIEAQVTLSSTRKRSYGTMQRFLDENEETGAFKVYKSCIFEAAQQCTEINCDECKKLIKGKWEDGTPRTFYSVCQQKMKRSRGFLPKFDIIQRFLRVDRLNWESQSECMRPSMEGLVHKWFDEEKHGIKFEYFPHYPVWESIDPGSPTSVHWYAETNGKHFSIDEIYEHDLAPSDLAEMIKKKRAEQEYQVMRTFIDPSAKGYRLELFKHGIKAWTVNNDVALGISEVRKWGEDDKIFIDKKHCPWQIKEAKVYHYPEKREGRNESEIPVKDFDHAMDDLRYYFSGRYLTSTGGQSGTLEQSAR